MGMYRSVGIRTRFVCGAVSAMVLLVLCPGTSRSAADDPAEQAPAFSALVGQWVRPDGGYTITIKSVDAAGKIDASYANPTPLPFSKARATKNGRKLELFFEIVAGGYAGSTYTLTLDPATDTLKGTYYQAVAKQKYDVFFRRLTPSE